MIILILILILVFGFGGWYGGERLGPGYGPHAGIGTVVLILLVLYLLGYLHR